MQDGDTALHAAAQSGSLEVFTKLLDSGADLHVRDKVSKIFNYVLGYGTQI